MIQRKIITSIILFTLMLLGNKSPLNGQNQPTLDITHSENNPLGIESTLSNFIGDIQYDSLKSTAFDIYMPVSTEPTSLIIFIHGGGFMGGYKEQAYERYEPQIKEILSRKIAFASINYRLLYETNRGVIASIEDSKKCLQFIKYYAKSFNIDKERIGIFGSSAGAGTSLWIGLNDDMALLESDDPILKESTRVQAIGAIASQATYDIIRWEEVFADYNLKLDNVPKFLTNRLAQFYGVDDPSAMETDEVINYRHQMDMIELMDKDDPPIWVKNEQKDVAPLFDLQHHPAHAKTIKKYASKAGLEHVVYAPALDIKPEVEEGLIDFFDRLLNGEF